MQEKDIILRYNHEFYIQYFVANSTNWVQLMLKSKVFLWVIQFLGEMTQIPLY